MSLKPFFLWKKVAKEEDDKKAESIAYILSTRCFDITDEVISCHLLTIMPAMGNKLNSSLDTISKWKHNSLAFELVAHLDLSKENFMVFEAAMLVLLAFRTDIIVDMNIPVYRMQKEFEAFYQDLDFRTNENTLICFEFTNFLILSLVLLRAEGKKNHHIELVSRVVEGKLFGGKKSQLYKLKQFIFDREAGIIIRRSTCEVFFSLFSFFLFFFSA